MGSEPFGLAPGYTLHPHGSHFTVARHRITPTGPQARGFFDGQHVSLFLEGVKAEKGESVSGIRNEERY